MPTRRPSRQSGGRRTPRRELKPDHAGAQNNLGVALYERSQFEEALSSYDRAIALQGDLAQAHSNRGNALQRLNRIAEAELAYRRAIELQPTFADAWNNLGACLRELRRWEEAEVVYRKSLELDPRNPDTLDNLALVLKDLDRLEEASDLMRRALALEEGSEKFHVHYAAVLLDQDKIDDAAIAIGRALSLNDTNPDAINLIGRVAFEQGDLWAAMAHYRRALALQPDLVDAYNNLGNVLKQLGRLDEARDAYIEAVRLDPGAIGVYVSLANSKTFAPGDQHLAAMQALAAQDSSLSKMSRLQLDFALGKAYADLKDHRRAFSHWLAGNAAKRATISYDETSALGFFDRIELIFTRELIAAKSGGGHASQMPIFVLGVPRSGTTLVEQIIASHPLVHGAGELSVLGNVIHAVRGPGDNPIPYPEFAPALDAAVLRQLGCRYVSEILPLALNSERTKVERVTDKMPSNYYFVGLIHLALPNAKIIHCSRDPLDTCLSCFSKLFTAKLNHTYDLGELGRYYKRYEGLMTHWRNVLPGGRMLEIQYEELVDDIESQARRIISHCGLPWHENCLEFHKTQRPIRTASATQVRQPIYKSSVGRWRVYEQELEPLVSALRAR